MQIDGHHTATYVAARLAGFTHDEAAKVGYAAQYVDDATNSGVIRFEGSPYMYARIASAHKMIDYSNLIEVENHLAWLPFHFLPGNGQLPDGQEPEGGEVAKLICKPDSHVARDMLRLAHRDRDSKRGLHRLGIAMHVYADTFAHQGFVGALSIGNQAKSLTTGDATLDKKIQSATKKELFKKLLDDIKAVFQLLVQSIRVAAYERKSPFKYWMEFMNRNPLGHAAADTYPDQPYLVWQYEDWRGELVKRDNPATFMQAMHMMVKAMRAWRTGDASMNLENHSGMDPADATVVEKLFRDFRDPDGDIRHGRWLKAISDGAFSFGPAPNLCYVGKGPGSWKEAALGTSRSKDTGLESFPYTPEFLRSDWKLFHDALQAHRADVVHEVLPRYGICAA